MKKRAEVLSFFLRKNGCMVDELTVYEKFIRHSMPHSLRCISDILDSLSVAHHITQGIHPPADTNKRVALFFPENEQPLWIPSRTGKTSPPHSRDNVFFSIELEDVAERKWLGETLIRHLAWQIGEKGLMRIVALGMLFCLLYLFFLHHYSFREMGICTVLFLGWWLSGIIVNKSWSNLESTKGICHVSGQDICTAISKSKAAYLFGLFPLGEISLTFYCTLLLSILLCPSNDAIWALIAYASLLSFPFIVYSAKWQIKIRKLCPICAGIIILLICQALFSLPYLKVDESVSSIIPLTISLGIIAFHMAVLFILIGNKLRRYTSNAPLREKHENLLFRNDIFQYLLNKSPKKIGDDKFVFQTVNNGVKEFAHRLTLVLNPTCHHCHKLISALHECEDSFRIDIIWVSPSRQSLIQSTWLLDIFIKTKHNALQTTVEAWQQGILPPKDWVPDPQTTSIIRQHNGFATRLNIRHTPSVFIDGKELPDIYNIQDIPFLF